jgi:SAM-dependent methyltransferase
VARGRQAPPGRPAAPRDDRAHWDARYGAAPAGLFAAAPADLLVAVARRLPRRGRALELAMGEGQNAVFLARRGLRVTGLDVSPVAVGRARARARAAGVPLAARVRDLRGARLRRGFYDLVTCFHYLDRALFSAMARALRPGGVLVVEIATVRNLERHPRPGRPYVLAEGELAAAFPGLEPLLSREGWMGDHCQAQLVARRPTAPDGPRAPARARRAPRRR